MLDDLTWTDGVGIVGSLTICAAYFLVTRGRLDAEGPAYNLINLGGAALLLFSLYFRPNPGAIVIEVLWAAIALTALVQILRRR
ncbi:MAG: hypothetical protein AAGE80_01705 [Pseudomonadota bacterium]